MEACQSPRQRSKSALRSKKRKFRLKQKVEVTPLSTITQEDEKETTPQQEEQATIDLSKTTLVDSTIDINQDLRPSAPLQSEDSESECPRQTESKYYENRCSSQAFSEQAVIQTSKQNQKGFKNSRNKGIVPLKISWKELSRRLNLDKNTEQNEKIQKIITYYNIICREDLLPPRSQFEGEEINEIIEAESTDDDDKKSQKSVPMPITENESCEETSQEESDSTKFFKSTSESQEIYHDAEKLQITQEQGPSQPNNNVFSKKLLKSPSTLLGNVSTKSKIAWVKARNSLKFALELKRNSKSFKNSVETNFEHSVEAEGKQDNNVSEAVNSIPEKSLLPLKNKWKQNGKLFRWTLKKTKKETLV